MHCLVIRLSVSQVSCLYISTLAVSQLNVIFSQLCMHSNKNEILTGTIEETRMKWSAGGNFPIFEIRNNGTTSLINIICITDVQNKTIFAFDPSIPSDSKNFVSIKIAIILLLIMKIEYIRKFIYICINNNICSILCWYRRTGVKYHQKRDYPWVPSWLSCSLSALAFTSLAVL